MGQHLIDLNGQTFGRLTVIRRDPRATLRSGESRWICRCRCGEVVSIASSHLRRGDTKSCGCYRNNCRKTHGESSVKHGRRRTPEYSSWLHMIQRCCNPRNDRWDSYGGRGVTVCDEWRHDFKQFVLDMGRQPARGMSLDRIDVDGPYAKWNCRWANRFQQQQNMRVHKRLKAG